jgi:carbonic anhydrase/acetyltransferase-like protein (isoleucine patch superfamily)
MTIEERLDYYLNQIPRIDDSVYIASDAVIVGAVTVAAQSSIWHKCVLRGDINSIEIGRGSNIQDGSVIHLADDYGVKVGDHVTVGHMAMIHACNIGDECLIGMHSTILDGSVIGEQSIVGAGSLVTKNTKVPPGSLVIGSPVKIVRSLSQQERDALKHWASKYVTVARAHKARFEARS